MRLRKSAALLESNMMGFLISFRLAQLRFLRSTGIYLSFRSVESSHVSTCQSSKGNRSLPRNHKAAIEIPTTGTRKTRKR